MRIYCKLHSRSIELKHKKFQESLISLMFVELQGAGKERTGQENKSK